MKTGAFTSMRRGSSIRAVFLSALSFLAAFCSLGYELLTASRLARAFGEGVFLYPVCVAVFVFFLGTGAVRAARLPVLHARAVFARLCRVEAVLVAAGAAVMPSIQLFLIDSLWGVNIEALVCGLVMAALIGYMSGQELPLLWRLGESLGGRPSWVRGMIAADYAASLAATLLCVWVFIGRWGFLRSGWIVAGFNGLLLAVLLIWGRRREWIKSSAATVSVISAGCFVWAAGLWGMPGLERFFLWREYFYHPAVKLVHYEYTPYQQVVIFAAHKDLNAPVPGSLDRLVDRPDRYRVLAVLNGSLQFDEPLTGGDDFDHHALFAPFASFRPREEVLILGGGDGLPARAALRLIPDVSATMVDIDGQWVELAKTHPLLRRVNGDALRDPRVAVVVGDAFQWVRTTARTFDLIAVDFPAEPRSLAKIRTFSLEFFRDLTRLRRPHTVVVIHNNEIFRPWIKAVIDRTARRADWFPVWGECVTEDEDLTQLVLFASRREAQAFMAFYRETFRPAAHRERYRRLRYETVSEPREAGRDDACVVSFYDPFLSCLPWSRKIELLRLFWAG